MNKISLFHNNNLNKFFYKLLNIFIFIFFIIILLLSFLSIKKKRGYTLFIEFNNAYGLKKGTNVNLRGVKIGHVHDINLRLNKVIILLHIDSLSTLIPRNSVIEASQTGLFNDVILDIVPLDLIQYDLEQFDLMSNNCIKSVFLCPNFYIKGYKGLNYDDLVRSVTRISQRFDDPRFFYLFYLLLQNSIDISGEITFLFHNLSYLIYSFTDLVPLIVYKYLL
uniref:Mce/MlaD domain-containing protein n=1 Tax=Alsidium seaforthii TaxID=2007182 RepID=A0A1Z1MD52_9FLOR|nr:hypothetical protein [Bryothamnion seaforthii]ARW63896.1 hypothetical protein [Bryothamnion seaforthii]